MDWTERALVLIACLSSYEGRKGEGEIPRREEVWKQVYAMARVESHLNALAVMYTT